jgi:hypothetical protein
MTSVWDSLPSLAKYAMGDYTHFVELAQALECPVNGDQQQIGDKLQGALQGTFGVNDDFAGPLNQALADRRVRDRVARLYKEDPAALNRALDQIIASPGNLAAIVDGIPLQSDRPATPLQTQPVPEQKTPPKEKKTAPVAAHPAQGSHHIENTGNAVLQAQMHMMGAHGGAINGSEKDLNAALKEYAKNHPGLNIAATDKDLSADQIKAVKEAVARDWQAWTQDKTNAQHLFETVNAGYAAGAKKTPNDAVKEMQTAVIAMGGALPRYGVDGVRWHETNKALREAMAPDGAYTKILDAAGIAHEWPGAKTDDKPAVTAENVRNGQSSGTSAYFNNFSDGDYGSGARIAYTPPRGTALQQTYTA